MNKIISLSKKHIDLLLVTILLLGSGVFSHILSANYSLDGGRLQIALSAKLLLLSSYLMAMALVVIYWSELKTKLTLTLWLWILILSWSLVTLIIGQLNIATVVRYLGFLGATLIGLVLFLSQTNSSRLSRDLFWVCLIIMLINLVAIDWHVLINAESKNIKGVFYQKNLLGHVSVFSIYVACFYWFSNKHHHHILSLLLLISAGWLLFISTSTTSYLLVLIAFLAILASLVINRYKIGLSLVITLFIFTTLALVLNWSEFFSLLGKNTTFTGRTMIWAEYWQLIESNLWLGHGYGAYPENTNNLLKVGPHSGYVELLYYIGAIGAVIFLSIVALSIRYWYLSIKYKELSIEASFLFGFIVMFLALNVTETYTLNRSGLFWPFFVYAALKLAYLHKTERVQIEKC